MFSSEIREIFQNTILYRTPLRAVSEKYIFLPGQGILGLLEEQIFSVSDIWKTGKTMFLDKFRAK